jgi:indolepyruvate ferredoxin oxidoreductase, alpha subunit
MSDMQLLKGLSEGLLDGGLEFISNFPGYMSHKLFDLCGGKITSVNEKIAYELAWGSSIGGKRSVTTFKNVGLNDAADPFINSMLLNINAGLVLVVFDDTDVEGSQCRLDSRHYFDFFGGLWFEPHDIQSAYDIAYKSFETSEKLNIPIVIRVTSQLLHQVGNYKRRPKLTVKGRGFNKSNKNYVVHPINSCYQLNQLEDKLINVQAFIDEEFGDFETNNQDSICLSFGSNSRELVGKTNIVQIDKYPLPHKIKSIKASKIEVFEQGTNFASEKVKSILQQTEIQSCTGNRPDNTEGYIISTNYRKLFEILNKYSNGICVGDLGEYTMDDLNSINACLCFGSALSVGAGLKISTNKEVFVITGDSSFLHSGKNFIPELLERNIKINLIVIDNGGSKGTGGQRIPGDIEASLKDLTAQIINFNEINQSDLERYIEKLTNSDKTSAIILNY